MDHRTLQWLQNSKDTEALTARGFAAFDSEIEHRSGKNNRHAECLSWLPAITVAINMITTINVEASVDGQPHSPQNLSPSSCQTPAVKQSKNTTIPRDKDGNNQTDDEQSQVRKSIDAEKLELTRLMRSSLLAEKATNPEKIYQHHTLQWWRSKEICFFFNVLLENRRYFSGLSVEISWQCWCNCICIRRVQTVFLWRMCFCSEKGSAHGCFRPEGKKSPDIQKQIGIVLKLLSTCPEGHFGFFFEKFSLLNMIFEFWTKFFRSLFEKFSAWLPKLQYTPPGGILTKFCVINVIQEKKLID